MRGWDKILTRCCPIPTTRLIDKIAIIASTSQLLGSQLIGKSFSYAAGLLRGWILTVGLFYEKYIFTTSSCRIPGFTRLRCPQIAIRTCHMLHSFGSGGEAPLVVSVYLTLIVPLGCLHLQGSWRETIMFCYATHHGARHIHPEQAYCYCVYMRVAATQLSFLDLQPQAMDPLEYPMSLADVNDKAPQGRSWCIA